MPAPTIPHLRVPLQVLGGGPALTNLVTDPGGEIAVKFSGPQPDFVVTREASGALSIPSHSGGFRDKHAYDGAGAEGNLGYFNFTFPEAGSWVASVYIWVPFLLWDGGTFFIGTDGSYAGSTITSTHSDPAIRNEWTRISTRLDVVAGDLTGTILLRCDSMPSSAEKGIMFTDSLQVEAGTEATPFIPSDANLSSGKATWNGEPNASTSTLASPVATFATVEQDSVEEIEQCVMAILRTPLGSRQEAPEFGIADDTFELLKAELSAESVLNAVEEQEPRAHLIGEVRLEELGTKVVTLKAGVSQ